MDNKIGKTDTEQNAEPNNNEQPTTSGDLVKATDRGTCDEEFLIVEGSASSPETTVDRVSNISAVKSISFYKNEEETKLKTDDVVVRCQICGKYQKNVSLLKYHMKYIHKSDEDKNEFNCPFCTTKFSSKKNRNEHMLMIHLLDKRKDLRCEICNKRFSSVENKNEHIFKHHSKSKCHNQNFFI